MKTELTFNLPQYHLESQNLEQIIKVSDGLKKARDTIKAQYPAIGVDITLSDKADYIVVLEAKNKKDLLGAVNDLLVFTGAPNRVRGEYGMLNKVLSQYGKETKFYIRSFADGRAVVEKK